MVSRDAPELLARFARQLAGVEGVRVLVDRRVGERRGTTDRTGTERRRGDRRTRPEADAGPRAGPWSTRSSASTGRRRPPPSCPTPILAGWIMAVFGAPISRPDDPVRAVRAALGMRRSLRDFNARQRTLGGVEIDIGIGISHGESISGNIGSEQRMEYTVIGDSVNLASRLEGLTKNHPYKILINDRIYEEVAGEFTCVLLGEEHVKGKAQAVRVYGVPDPPA